MDARMSVVITGDLHACPGQLAESIVADFLIDQEGSLALGAGSDLSIPCFLISGSRLLLLSGM